MKVNLGAPALVVFLMSLSPVAWAGCAQYVRVEEGGYSVIDVNGEPPGALWNETAINGSFADNQGSQYFATVETLVVPDWGGENKGVVKRVSPTGQVSRFIVYDPQRRAPQAASLHGIEFDAVNGEMIMYIQDQFCTGMVKVRGFATLFQVLTTYTPTEQVVVEPATFPEGILPDLDAQDVLTGDVATLPNYSQTIRKCDVIPSPQAGRGGTISDPLPTPAPGQALYYLIASRSGSQTRTGRSFDGLQFHGRAVGGLPPCDFSGPWTPLRVGFFSIMDQPFQGVSPCPSAAAQSRRGAC